MIDFDEINRELMNVQVKASDMREIKNVLKKKFNLYFDSDEVKVLAKITTPALTVILKKINSIRLTNTGEVTIDTFFAIQKDLVANILTLKEDEYETAHELMQKLLVIAAIKVDESDDMSFGEKFDVFDLAIRNAEKIVLVHAVPLTEVFPHAEPVLQGLRKKYKTVEVNFLKKKPRKAMSNKLRSRLQKEINSKCPFCPDEDVEYFDGHHIDDDRSNTVFENMLLLCKKCHTKIGTEEIKREDVIAVKNGFRISNSEIEVYKISIDSNIKCWEEIPNATNAFRLLWKVGNGFPIFQIHFINHLDKTVVLIDVELRIKHFHTGMGDLPQPCEVPKCNLHRILIRSDKEVHKPEKFQGIQIPSKQSLIFETEVANYWDNEYTNLDRKMVLYFTLKFSNNLVISVPRILLNGEDENDGVTLMLLS